MDAQTCLKKMQLAGTLSLATVDESGAPQIRCVSAVHYEPRAIYFLRHVARRWLVSLWLTDVSKRLFTRDLTR